MGSECEETLADKALGNRLQVSMPSQVLIWQRCQLLCPWNATLYYIEAGQVLSIHMKCCS